MLSSWRATVLGPGVVLPVLAAILFPMPWQIAVPVAAGCGAAAVLVTHYLDTRRRL